MKGNTNSQAGESIGAPDRSVTDPPPRILVVDDDQNIRRFSALLLTECGYQVDVAEDGAAGWDALQTSSYDLLIADHNMPKVSGLEMIKKVRSVTANLPIILMSGSMPTEALHQQPWLGLSAMLVKPFTTDELLGTVDQILRSLAPAITVIPCEFIAPTPEPIPCNPSALFTSPQPSGTCIT